MKKEPKKTIWICNGCDGEPCVSIGSPQLVVGHAFYNGCIDANFKKTTADERKQLIKILKNNCENC